MKSALQVSSHLSLIKDNYKALDYKDVFYMATLGGAAGNVSRVKRIYYIIEFLFNIIFF